MEIKFLGSGSAFVTSNENFQSNILLTQTIERDILTKPDPFSQGFGLDGGVVATGEKETITKRLLIDAGEQINDALYYYNINPLDIDSILITHLHSDHCSGLNFLGFKTYFIPPFGTNKPQLVGNVKVLDTLWDNVLSGTMRSLNGSRATLETYFNVTKLAPKQSIKFGNVDMHLTSVPHVIDDIEEVPAFGVKFEDDDIKVFITGDTQFDFWKMIGNYEWATWIFHDCEMMEYPNSVHAQFHQLSGIPTEYKKKMWLYHYMLYGKTFEELEQEVLAAGFAGLVRRGQTFNTKDLTTFNYNFVK